MRPMLLVALILVATAGRSIADADAPPFAAVAVLTGTATVKDGDGLLFGDVEIRLQGIAAPEHSAMQQDPYGAEARDNLARLLGEGGRGIVECHLDGTIAGAGRRPVAWCWSQRVGDLGAAQIAAGFARDCPHFSKGRYAALEQSARRAGRNLSLVYPLPRYC